MIQLRVFSFLVPLLVVYSVYGQYQLTGQLLAKQDSSFVKGCLVSLNVGNRTATTDEEGKFIFGKLTAGTYELYTNCADFKSAQLTTTITNDNRILTIWMVGRNETLNEVVVTEKQTDFGFTRMRAVESMGIYEGKKSEVILPEQLVANLATNNARQIYARVAGLNIWENEGAGLQLSIGGRGLDPNRSSNFNVRQNGHDISADALGYPESYYTPPIEAVGRIQIVRGAASLQYGTQFGGLLNFVMKKPVQNRKFELIARQTIGSFGFYNAFTSASGTVGKLSYYTFGQYKQGNGWRPNSHFTNGTFYADVDYRLSEKTSVGVDVTPYGLLGPATGRTDRPVVSR